MYKSTQEAISELRYSIYYLFLKGNKLGKLSSWGREFYSSGAITEKAQLPTGNGLASKKDLKQYFSGWP